MSMKLFEFSGGQPLECMMAQLATSRLACAFTESTKRAYSSMFRVFVAFAVFMTWDIHPVTVLQLLCFLKCLLYNGVKAPQMANYLSTIKTKFTILGLDVTCFADTRLKYYQKAVQLHSPLQVKLKKVIDVSLLYKIVQQCDYTYVGQVFKAVFFD